MVLWKILVPNYVWVFDSPLCFLVRLRTFWSPLVPLPYFGDHRALLYILFTFKHITQCQTCLYICCVLCLSPIKEFWMKLHCTIFPIYSMLVWCRKYGISCVFDELKTSKCSLLVQPFRFQMRSSHNFQEGMFLTVSKRKLKDSQTEIIKLLRQ